MSTMITTSPRIYVADLSAYNAGNLHGRWINADQDADDIRAEIAEMLRESPCPNTVCECPRCAADITVPVGECAEDCPVCKGTNEVTTAEEWAIHDFEGFEGIRLSEQEDIDTVADLAAAIEEHGEPFAVWWNNENRDSVDVDRFLEQYRGTYSSLADYAEEVIGNCYEIDKLPDVIRFHIDWDGIGRDMELGGDIWTHEGGDGVYVFDNH